MPIQHCADETAHGPHEWYWQNILRRECPGLVVAGNDDLRDGDEKENI